MLKNGGLMNPDRKAGKEEMEGFDYMDKSTIEPKLEMIKEIKASEAVEVEQ